MADTECAPSRALQGTGAGASAAPSGCPAPDGSWDCAAAKELAARYCIEQGIGPVSNAENDLKGRRMVCDDGRVYRETPDGYWAQDTPDPDVLYLGASKHGAGVTLMPFAVRVDGTWIRLSTGKPHHA